MKIQTRASLVSAGVLATLISVHGAARADDASGVAGAQTASAQSQPEAIGRAVAAKLQAVRSLRADFEEIDSYPGKYKNLAQRGTVLLSRPGSLKVDIHRYRRVDAGEAWTASGNDTTAISDGKTYWFAFLHPHSTQVRHEADSAEVRKGALKTVAPLSGFFVGEEVARFPGQNGEAKSLPDETWEGAPYNVVQYGSGDGNATAYVGGDSLIHRLVVRTETPKGTVTKEWNLRNIQIDPPLKVSEFVYQPPADATALDKGDRGAPLAEGTPAPDFTVVDAHGKPVRLSDYKGKTVILDFWATWCWTCNQSLPHAEEVARQYRDKDVVTLAVAVWDSKTGFDAWLAKHSYPDIQFAIDTTEQGKDVATTLFHVSATPTAYVIGPDGKVAKVIAGYTGKTNELEAAVELARSPKTASAH